MAQGPKAGDRAPDFELEGPGGRTVKLSDLVRDKTVVLYFYPKDETPGCTVEACTFRDQYEDFTAAGAEVVGVSRDTGESHERFAKRHRLPFTLLSDPGGDVHERYGVAALFGLIPARTTFVIDRKGVVRYVFESRLQFKEHVARALDTVKRLEAESRAASARPA